MKGRFCYLGGNDMVNREIVDYISGSLRRGMTYDEIHQQLLMRGYFDFDIQEAMRFLQTGKTLSSGETSINHTKLGVRWFFLSLGLILFIVFVFIIFGIVFSDSKVKVFDVDEEALHSGTELSLGTQNIIMIYNNLGESLNVTIEEGVANFAFGEIDFYLNEGGSYELDSDFDGFLDLILEFNGGDENKLFLQYKCIESWICSDWGLCVNGVQSRVCSDENFCETEKFKPELTKVCSVYVNQSFNSTFDNNFYSENLTNQSGEYVFVNYSNYSEKKFPSIESSISMDFLSAIYSTGENLNGSYDIWVDYNNTKVSVLFCYLREGYGRFCGEQVSLNDTGILDLSGKFKAFYFDNETHFSYFGGINYPGIYQYEIYLYSCESINSRMDIDNCSISDERMGEFFSLEVQPYDYEFRNVNIQGEVIPFECLKDSDCLSENCVAGECRE